jgi:uncharacterized protein YcbX
VATIAALRRYPVKAMGGESPAAVELDGRGVAGDRWYAVLDAEDKMAAFKNSNRFRRHDAVGDFAASTSDDGVRVSRGGESWHVEDPALAEVLTEAFGAPVRVAPETTTPHFDASPVSVVGTATLDWCRDTLGVDPDPRRLRVNLLVDTTTPFEEESWTTLSVGTAALRAVERIERCRTIDLAQDGVETTTRWLKPLADAREMRVGVYLDVVTPGRVAVGDEVEVG